MTERHGDGQRQGVPGVTLDVEARAGDVGDLIALQARSYARSSGFGRSFEALLAREIGDFAARNDPSSRMWFARAHERLCGSITIERRPDSEEAHLRWFIVETSHRGTGLGRHLLDSALEFCDARDVVRTSLWTFDGLTAARALYESRGFELVQERTGNRWSAPVLEQRFVRTRVARKGTLQPPAILTERASTKELPCRSTPT